MHVLRSIFSRSILIEVDPKKSGRQIRGPAPLAKSVPPKPDSSLKARLQSSNPGTPEPADVRQRCYNKATNAWFSTQRRFRLAERQKHAASCGARRTCRAMPTSFRDFLVRSEVVQKVNDVNDIVALTTINRTLNGKDYFARRTHLFGDGMSASEEADNYHVIVARLNGNWRVIVCRAGIQWILQRRAGERHGRARWASRSYFRTSEGLIRFSREYAGEIEPDACAVLAALPARISTAALLTP
jgi:hypothetical protein